MINTIETITTPKEWIVIGSVEAHKTYRISYTPTEITSVDMHLHDEKGNHLAPLGSPGGSAFSGFKYKYVFSTVRSGELAIRITAGTLENIVLEEEV